MAKNKDVPAMISGLGMGLRLISLLIESVERNGGHIEELHYLTTDRGKENLERVGEFIAKLPWQIPLTEVMRQARARAEEQYAAIAENGEALQRLITEGENFEWVYPLELLKIPMVRFSDNEYQFDEYRPIPQELRDQINGRVSQVALPVTYNGKPYIVIEFVANTNYKLGETIQVGDECIDLLSIAPSCYFDFDH